MRLVNLEKENKNRYKVVLSREDWKKIFLEISHNSGKAMVFLLIMSLLIFFITFSYFYNIVDYLFHPSDLLIFWVMIFVFMLFPVLISYYKFFKTALIPFKLNGVEIDVGEKKILLKNKTFSLKDTDILVFYLERNGKKNKNLPNKNNDKSKISSNLVYYVKKKEFPRPNNEELRDKGFLDNYFEEFIISPVEIKYLEDFSLVLGKDGILGTWRQIAVLLGVGFEENIEFEEERLLNSNGRTAFSYKTSKDSSIIGESPFLFDLIDENEKKLCDLFTYLEKKVKEKDTSRSSSLSSPDFGTFMLFKERLMGIRVFFSGFEVRFWRDYSVFPDKEQVVNKRFVFKKLIRITLSGFAIFITMFFLNFLTEDFLPKTCLYVFGVLLFIFIIWSEFNDKIANMRSNRFWLLILYLIGYLDVFMIATCVNYIELFLSNYSHVIFNLVSEALIFSILFFLFLGDLYDFSCPWNLTINRYMSRLVFSFEDKVLEGEYGFCVSRTHWQAPASKVQSLALLKIGRSLFGSGDFLLTIKIEEDYVVLPLPKLEEDKILEILFFLQEIFNTLLAAFYSVNNIGRRK